MKTVLKDVKTGLLFQNMDQWTASLTDAAGFRDTVTAIRFCQRNNLFGVAVVQMFEGGAIQRVAGFHKRNGRPSEATPQVNA